jgi:hypothetical protein
MPQPAMLPCVLHLEINKIKSYSKFEFFECLTICRVVSANVSEGPAVSFFRVENCPEDGSSMFL